jgi:uncharacterized protein YbjT (DUF2867 family)
MSQVSPPVERPDGAYAVIVLGGTGEVGGAAVRAFLADPRCARLRLLARRAVEAPGPRAEVQVVDTGAPDFEAVVAAAAAELGPGTVIGACCVGVGAGSARWSEAELLALEVGVVGAFARGCRAGGVGRFGLLTSAGADPRSRARYTRIMGLKEEAARAAGFPQLALFRPGVIGGNAHTPGYAAALGWLVPGRWGLIAQEAIGRAFPRALGEAAPGERVLHNGDMR